MRVHLSPARSTFAKTRLARKRATRRLRPILPRGQKLARAICRAIRPRQRRFAAAAI